MPIVSKLLFGNPVKDWHEIGKGNCVVGRGRIVFMISIDNMKIIVVQMK